MVEPVAINDSLKLVYAGKAHLDSQVRKMRFESPPPTPLSGGARWSLNILTQEAGEGRYAWKAPDGAARKAVLREGQTLLLCSQGLQYQLEVSSNYRLSGATLFTQDRETLDAWLAPFLRRRNFRLDSGEPFFSIHPCIARVRNSLDELGWEFRQRRMGFVSAARGLLELLKAGLERNGDDEADVSSPARSDPPAIAKAYDYFNENLNVPLTLTGVSRAVGLSPNALMVSFRRSRNKSPMACLRELRLKTAHAMLQNEHLRVKEVAAAVGYSSLDVFSRTYKRYYRCSPLEVRRKAQLEVLRTRAWPHASDDS